MSAGSMAAALASAALGFGLGALWAKRRSRERRRTRVMQMAKAGNDVGTDQHHAGRGCPISERPVVRPDRVALYKRHHQGVWPEVEQGLAAVGVETISIWSDPKDETSLFMYLEMDEDAGDMGEGSKYRENPRVRDWERAMETEFHSGWQKLNEWYTLKSCGSRQVQLSTNSLPPCYDIMGGK
ncbi:unnamed protein product [Effrenium voratum]|nr:unnamed protein product [Effrenium voratum]